MTDDLPPVASRQLTPTDVSQFLRLDRCERFLRLRLHERVHGRRFLKELGVVGQEPPPILTRSGAQFETEVVGRITERWPTRSFAAPVRDTDDNDALVAAVAALRPGGALVTLQPRLDAYLGDWRLHGDPDLLLWRRDGAGRLALTIVDIKSSAEAKVEHRLQVAFYDAMLAQLLPEPADVDWGVLYRGPADPDAERDPEAREKLRRDAAALGEVLGVDGAFLERVGDPDAYRAEVDALVTGERSAAARIAAAPFTDLFFCLGVKCDGCLYNELCLKQAHASGDVALTPYLSGRDKKALLAAGVRRVHDLAALKDVDGNALTPAPGAEPTLARLAAGSVGPRLDELVLRARATRIVKRDLNLPSLSYIPNLGHTTLPHTAPGHNANLVTVFVDVQHDPVERRIWLLAARIVAHADGAPARIAHVVRLADSPPDTAQKEADLFAAWIAETLATVVTLAEPDESGARKAPLHLVFWNDFGQTQLLEALARNLGAMVHAAPALYDFLTQLAAFDSPVATFLDDELRQRRNLPMLCQSLMSVASYFKFEWGDDLRRRFYERCFDAGRGDDEGGRYEGRSRHSSQVPAEYAYAAWDALEPPRGGDDPFRSYRGTTPADLDAFARKRVDALAHVAAQLPGNDLSLKTAFDLPALESFTDVARTLAEGLREFCTIERHAFLSAWRDARQIAPERRALKGETLLVRYDEADQEEGVAEAMREAARRKLLRDRFYAEYRAANPDKKQVRLPKEQDAVSKWSIAGMRLRLRLIADGTDADVATLLGLCNAKDGERLILAPRHSVDERKPEAERTPFTPTPKQLLYGSRVELETIAPDGDGVVAIVTVCGPGGVSAGYLFNAIDRPLEPGALYTLDPDVNDIYGLWQKKVVDELVAAEASGTTDRHPLYRRLACRDLSPAPWPAEAADGQARFLAGLDAFHAAGRFHDFEPSKRAYIGSLGDAPILLLQGPPGTGKSYATAFAVLARVQGALVAGEPMRVLLSCKTHSATDVLVRGVADALGTLEKLRAEDPTLFDAHFDPRLLEVPLLRIAGKTTLPERIEPVGKDEKPAERLAAHEHLIAAATPGGIYSLIHGKWKELLGHGLCELLVLDEASQLGLPEAMVAALPLSPSGRVIVVGDPRQMPPIVQHAWESEPRRTFAAFQTYQSLFDALRGLGTPFLQFAESFRVHAAIARFLKEAIYRHDGIDYRSKRTATLPPHPSGSALADAALAPEFPLVVVVHGEAQSQTRNAFEEALVGPILRALADSDGLGLTARDGFGVVVPHRAQRSALRKTYPELCVLDDATGQVLVEAVDTVERYQGDEREAILISATESDPEYLSASAGFLLDPRRLNVALSRAKKKLVLVASRSVFEFVTADDTLFAHVQLWKSLLRRACRQLLWRGEVDGIAVEVWGGR